MPLLFPDGCSFGSNGVGCTKRAGDVPWTRNPRIPSGIKKSSEEKNMEKRKKKYITSLSMLFGLEPLPPIH